MGFVSLVAYFLFYRRDRLYQWAVLSVLGLFGTWTLAWFYKILSLVFVNEWSYAVFQFGEMNLLVGLSGFIYTRFSTTASARFRWIFGGGCLLLLVGILAMTLQSKELMVLFRLGRIGIQINLLLICWGAITNQSDKTSGWLMGVSLLIVLFLESQMLWAYGAHPGFALFVPMPIWVPFGSSAAHLLTIIVQLARYHSTTRRQLTSRTEEVVRLLEDKRVLLEQQNARLVEEVSKRTADLERSNLAKVKLFSIISHDLRSPLVSLRNSLNLVHQKNLSQNDFADLVQRITQHIQRLSSSLDNLLQWSMSQLDEIRSRPAPLELRETIDDILELAEEATQQKGLFVFNNVPYELLAFADENQVRTILRNLIDNAIKFTPIGGHLSIRAEHDSESVTVCVEDSGTGMTAQQLSTLFSAAASRRGTNGEQGIGLGMRLCFDLAQRNGGSLAVESAPGEGTCVRLTLPLALDLAEQVV